jgi:hypothetical protein
MDNYHATRMPAKRASLLSAVHIICIMRGLTTFCKSSPHWQRSSNVSTCGRSYLHRKRRIYTLTSGRHCAVTVQRSWVSQASCEHRGSSLNDYIKERISSAFRHRHTLCRCPVSTCPPNLSKGRCRSQHEKVYARVMEYHSAAPLLIISRLDNMIWYDYLCNDAFGTTSLSPLVVSSIGIIILRDSEDDRLLEVLARDFQSRFNTVPST